MPENRKSAIILASKAFGTLEGKTANDLVIYGGKYEISAVIDEEKAGKDAGEVLGVGKKNIPIVRNLKEALKYKPGAMIIGIAPPGGCASKRMEESSLQKQSKTGWTSSADCTISSATNQNSVNLQRNTESNWSI